ncbi:DUF726 domain-containing protein [Heliobacterium chlorum]|uniref:DUF726 domain-containing protein n=1 Tax=Heliobacterium chlorum TaxID=2698 RepID=A0ABR7T5Q7_HELCL|nr:DUF726 domain-containing protein [Heliobacterium chlorum]MBC9786108.1 DUF726 domain-containing protein [Heliobacterium chlorum]
MKDYSIIFKRDKVNIQKTITITGCLIGGAIIFGLSAGAAAPTIATSLGSAGLLGTASTGTAISSLYGAALTNASLAALGLGSISSGGFGVAGGIAFITATGAALGAKQGAIISNNYIGNVKDFNIQKVRDGEGPAIIFINGFLSQKNQSCTDWLIGIKDKYPNNPCYFVTWESKSNKDLGEMAFKISTFKRFVNKMPKMANLNMFKWSSIVGEVIANPWHCAMVKASMTGILLADLISRVKSNNGYILMGHSLGSRVIYYLLQALSTRSEQYIKEVHLFGGAVERRTSEWERLSKSVSGKIYNYYSLNDSILRFLYRSANANLSAPIGLGEISCKKSNVVNYNVSCIVNSHMDYKPKLGRILDTVTF